MKIQGPNLTRLATYRTQPHQQKQLEKMRNHNDKINISNKALELQQNNKANQKHTDRIQAIKEAIESGEYEIDVEKTAENMISFWSGRS